MSVYRVLVSVSMYRSVEVEAADEDAARIAAVEEVANGDQMLLEVENREAVDVELI